jgi:hypothetical protein
MNKLHPNAGAFSKILFPAFGSLLFTGSFLHWPWPDRSPVTILLLLPSWQIAWLASFLPINTFLHPGTPWYHKMQFIVVDLLFTKEDVLTESFFNFKAAMRNKVAKQLWITNNA